MPIRIVVVSRGFRGRDATTSRSFLFVERELSVQAISWVLEKSESRLGSRHVLISIANHAKSDGTGAWPSVQTISHEARLSEREVRYALRDLEKSGELLTLSGEGPRGCNLYSLPLMGQSLQGQKTTQGGQNTSVAHTDFAPEPSFNRPKPSKTRLQTPQAPSPHKQFTNTQAKQNRIAGDLNRRIEANVGSRETLRLPRSLAKCDPRIQAEILALAKRKRMP